MEHPPDDEFDGGGPGTLLIYPSTIESKIIPAVRLLSKRPLSRIRTVTFLFVVSTDSMQLVAASEPQLGICSKVPVPVTV